MRQWMRIFLNPRDMPQDVSWDAERPKEQRPVRPAERPQVPPPKSSRKGQIIYTRVVGVSSCFIMFQGWTKTLSVQQDGPETLRLTELLWTLVEFHQITTWNFYAHGKKRKEQLKIKDHDDNMWGKGSVVISPPSTRRKFTWQWWKVPWMIW